MHDSSQRSALLILLSFFMIIQLKAQDCPRTLYVMQGWGSNSLSKMNMETGAITLDFQTNVGITPNQIITQNHKLYIINSIPDEIKVIDPMNDTADPRSIALTEGSNPWFMTFAGEKTAYVTNNLSNSVTKLNTETGQIETTIGTGQAPQGLIVGNNYLYVTNSGTVVDGWNVSYIQGTVSVIDLDSDTVQYRVNVPTNPQQIVLNTNQQDAGYITLHVMCSGAWGADSGRVVVIKHRITTQGIESPSVTDTLHVGGFPEDLVVTPDGKGYLCDWGGEYGHMYVYDAKNGNVLRGSTNPIPIGAGASRLLYDTYENCIWVSNQTNGTVQKFSVGIDTVIATYQFGLSAQDITIMEPYTSVRINEQTEPRSIQINQNFPNPFNPETNIPFTLSQSRHIRMSILNTKGQLIKILADSYMSAGEYSLTWDGTNRWGIPVASGTYFCRLEHNHHHLIQKMNLVR